MRIKTEEDFMKMALATAIAIEMSPIIKESMLAVYDFALEIETKHGHKTTVEDMKENTVQFLTDASNHNPLPIPQEFEPEIIGKCYGAWLWCLNMVEMVENKHEVLTAMSELHGMFDNIQKREFQENNR